MKNSIIMVTILLTFGVIGGVNLENTKREKITKNAIDIVNTKTENGYVNNITLEDGSTYQTNSKNKLVRQEELNQFITVDGEDFDYIKIPSHRQ